MLEMLFRSRCVIQHLYGPFWISVALIVTTGIFENLSKYIKSSRAADQRVSAAGFDSFVFISGAVIVKSVWLPIKSDSNRLDAFGTIMDLYCFCARFLQPDSRRITLMMFIFHQMVLLRSLRLRHHHIPSAGLPAAVVNDTQLKEENKRESPVAEAQSVSFDLNLGNDVSDQGTSFNSDFREFVALSASCRMNYTTRQRSTRYRRMHRQRRAFSLVYHQQFLDAHEDQVQSRLLNSMSTMPSEDGASLSAGAASRRAVKEDEWACVDSKCAFINRESYTSCRSCGKEKPRVKLYAVNRIGPHAAEQSKGFFSPYDWVCMECNNVNWARRKACNVCKAQRFGSCKARTGYGGGYMDRQDVEYISRKRDDEFDEFGRKKKGIKRSSDVIESEYCDGEEEFHRKAHKYEEEEDESGDDDLGKYDFGSDDEFESLKMSLAKKVAEANNASRASSPCSCSCSEGEDQICSCDESDTERTSRDQHPRTSGSRSDRRRHHKEERLRIRNDYDRYDRSRRDHDFDKRDRRHCDRRDSYKRGRSRSKSPRRLYQETDPSRRGYRL
ncbi:hypothetical protein QR680_000911 [Steinernema hermaphroditum]|uniref:RanBP2-type domain-containing protein n=1 Tax=Steinernema hermaphroditum TaxID=289476 RepID=A0AA39LEX2_9BILA|nr:hypothetical protein QR680_000911 [Steinernema hermaphroditum]